MSVNYSESNIYTIVSTIKYLYHSTTIRNERSKDYFDEIMEYTTDYTLPKYGEFSTRLDIEKFFTVKYGCNYISSCQDMVYLEYDVIKPLRLFNMMKYYKDVYGSKFGKDIPCRCDVLAQLNISNVSSGYDGYTDREDCIEVCLFRANECVSPNFRRMNVVKCGYDIASEIRMVMG